MGSWIMNKDCCLEGAKEGFFFRMMDGRFLSQEGLLARQKGKIEWSFFLTGTGKEGLLFRRRERMRVGVLVF